MKNQYSRNNDSDPSGLKLTRRDVLKGLATLPVVGALFYGAFRKAKLERFKRSNLAEMIGIDYSLPSLEIDRKSSAGQKIRLGIIGCGIRGKQLLRAAGFPLPEWIDEAKSAAVNDPGNTRYEDYMKQDDLNVEITGVCDIFDAHARDGIMAGSNINRQGVDGNFGPSPKRFVTYRDLIRSDEVDAVIIATPDHWHVPIAIEAARNSKHVYLEKPLSWNIPETFEVYKVVKQSGITFQLGHQGRQVDTYTKAREAYEKNILGPVSLVQTGTNRNTPNGAWVYDIHPEASPDTIDWEQFIGQSPPHEFDLERFFRWRCWYDYSTGLVGDLLTHEFDAINQIMSIGIPKSAIASGGIYYFKDGRNVPDTLQVVFEFPERDMTMLYTATLSNNNDRPKCIMGHDATMSISDEVVIKVGADSTRFQDSITSGLINPDDPIFHYIQGEQVDAVTSATSRYFASRGLYLVYRSGKWIDITHLHIAEWLDCIRTNSQPSCNIERAFEEGIATMMTTKSLKEGRKVFWDSEKNMII